VVEREWEFILKSFVIFGRFLVANSVTGIVVVEFSSFIAFSFA
jgi:hypothetical protein